MRRFMAARSLRLVLLLAAILTFGSCGKGSSVITEDDIPYHVPPQWPTADELSTERAGCDPTPAAALPGGSFFCAVTDSVLPGRAPVPHNAGERLVFAHLYETLVRADCQGDLAPGLAARWTCTEDSTAWVFSLRPDARFWDGTPVTAADVREAWVRNQALPRGRGETSPWAWLDVRGRSVRALDAQRLAIYLPEPQAGFPLLMAHPATAVAVRRPGWTWPVGSGPCRLRASTPAPLPDLPCRPNTHHPQPPIWKQLTFLVDPGADSRDLVSSQADVMVVRATQDVAFYDEAPGFYTVPLPWDRLYVLLCPPDQNPTGSDRWLAAAKRLDLPGDITGIATTGWSSIVFPDGDPASCPQLTGPVATSRAAPVDWQLAEQRLDENVVLYDNHDDGGRELAERLAALTGPDIRTAGLGCASFSFALQWQMAGACVVAMDQDYPGPCLQLAALLGRAAWLQQAALQPPRSTEPETLAAADTWSASARPPVQATARRLVTAGYARPLALTRPWLVLRSELAGIELDYDGTPLLGGLGRPEAGTSSP